MDILFNEPRCLGVRLLEKNQTTNAKSPALFLENNRFDLGTVLNSRISSYLLRAISSSLNIDEGYVGALPLPYNEDSENLGSYAISCIAIKRLLIRREFNSTHIRATKLQMCLT